MPNIKPISDLKDYHEVLRSCRVGEPVFLTKDGKGRYFLLDIQEYERQQATITLLSKLAEGENAIKTGEEWETLDDLSKSLGG